MNDYPVWQETLRKAQAEKRALEEAERLSAEAEKQVNHLRDGAKLRDALVFASVVDKDTPVLENRFEIDQWAFQLTVESDGRADIEYGHEDRVRQFTFIVRRVMPRQDEQVGDELHGRNYAETLPLRALAKEILPYSQTPFMNYGNDETADRVYFQSRNTMNDALYAEDKQKFLANLADTLDHLESIAQRYMPRWERFVTEVYAGAYMQTPPLEETPTAGERLHALIEEIVANAVISRTEY